MPDVKTIPPSVVMRSITPKSHWRLVWADEFDRPGLPDPAKWNYEQGFVRNNELQVYTAGRLTNARIENSTLILEARREVVENPNFVPGSDDWRFSQQTGNYSSASLTTMGKAEWLYGRIEASAKLPNGAGVWPAIWMLGAAISRRDDSFINWPRCGEIDIMEYVGSDPEVIHGTLHFEKEGEHAQIGAKNHVGPHDDQFHHYAVEWSPEQIEFFYDGTRYHSVSVEDLTQDGYNGFRVPHFLIVNLALGGGWAGPVDDAKLPQQFVLDYIRVYQRHDVP